MSAADDPLPSWNEGAAKTAILDFVRRTTDSKDPDFVREGDRIAAFDQDGTLWVEHPYYTQVAFALQRLADLAPAHPEWQTTEPYKSALAGDLAAFAKFTMNDLEQLVAATHAGMTTAGFHSIVVDWIAKAKHPRWDRPYTDLVYQPMLEVMQYLRANRYKVYVVTGGGQAFVRAYADRVYDAQPEEIIGSSLATQFEYDDGGEAVLMRPPKLLLYDDAAGKPQDIYLFLGRPPRAAFGNSTGDQQMLEYTQSGGGARLMALVLHDDDQREYAYGPDSAQTDSKFGAFTQALYDKAKAKGWIVVSIKRDWKRIFAFEH
ncbi:MAG TPA: HAD family hydrolase [Candidatus Tumulicola sp.]|nr:HAD family hydrolase [Candidatus Tumulicola sp.]